MWKKVLDFQRVINNHSKYTLMEWANYLRQFGKYLERWSTLNSAMQAQLHPGNSLSVRVKLLEDKIYSEASKIFG